MAYWGVEVKPGEPYVYEPGRGRLCITQALLGSHADVGWSILECNVGNMNPVRMCVLKPTNHICDLEIEYEERESVFFSVSGSSSIHLSGRIYNHSASDDQVHTSNKRASKTESPACLKRQHQGNEANRNKKPSLKEPTVAKADAKNHASSKETLISEAGGKNVASPKHPIVGEDDYSDEHLPIRVAYEKRMAARKESGVVQAVPIQVHEIAQEDIVTKADGKNEASLKEPIISEPRAKNFASSKQPIVDQDDYSDEHLPICIAYKKRMAARKESSVMQAVPIRDYEIAQEDIVSKADGKNETYLEEPIISEARGKNFASSKQPIVDEDDYSDEHLPICIAYKKRMAARKESGVVQTVPIRDHEIAQEDIITKADGKNEASLKEPIICEASGKNTAPPEQHIVSEDGHIPNRVAHKKKRRTRKESSVAHTVTIQDHEIRQDIVTKANGKNDAFPEEPVISEASGKNAASAKKPIVGEDDDLLAVVAHKKRMATTKESGVVQTVPIRDHEIAQEDIITKADGKNEASLKEPIICEASGKNTAPPKQHIVSEDGHLPNPVAHKKKRRTRKRKNRTPRIEKVLSGQNNDYAIMESSVAHTVTIQDHEIRQDIVTKAKGKNDAFPEQPVISEASGKNAASAKKPVVGEDDDLLAILAHKKRMATTKTKYRSPGMGKVLSDHNNDHKIMDSNVMHTIPTQDHEVTQEDNISQLLGPTGQQTRDNGFLFTGATNQDNWVSVEEFHKGDGKSTASNGSKVTVEYVGKLLDGRIVDPMGIRKFKLGAGEVIPGWDAGISGMRVGSKRKVIIPPALGHGNEVGMIPENSWLVYEFKLKKVRRTKKASEVSKNPS